VRESAGAFSRREGAALWPALLVMDWFYGDGVHGWSLVPSKGTNPLESGDELKLD